MLWIECRKYEPVPEELFYTGCQTDSDHNGETPLRKWIYTRYNEPIPEQLKYTGWHTDNNCSDNETPLQHCIKHKHNKSLCNPLLEPHSDIPEELFYPKYQTLKELKYPGWQTDINKNGFTPLMIWIKYRTDEPILDELFYPGCQFDKNRDKETALILWIRYRYCTPEIGDLVKPCNVIPERLLYPSWSHKSSTDSDEDFSAAVSDEDFSDDEFKINCSVFILNS
jgi:hypothetical protein